MGRLGLPGQGRGAFRRTRLLISLSEGANKMVDDAHAIKYFKMSISFDQSLAGLIYDYGPRAAGWTLLLMCACAAQQIKEPLYFVRIHTSRDLAIMTKNCFFESTEQLMDFVDALEDEGLCIISEKNGMRYLTFPSVLDSASSQFEAIRRRSEQGRRAAVARWSKNKAVDVADDD